MGEARDEQQERESTMTRVFEHIARVQDQFNRLAKDAGVAGDDLLESTSLLPQLGLPL